MPPFRYLYLGVPLGARVLTGAGYPPVAAAFAPLDLPGRRWARRALGPRALLLGRPDLEALPVQAVLSTLALDAIVSFFWPRRIPSAVLALAPAWGTHPSLLPRWRGPDPYFWTIRSGDTEAGVSLFELDERYDTGPVVKQARVSVGPEMDAWALARALDRPALALLLELAESLARGERPAAAPQRDEGATEAPSPTPEQQAIDWKMPAEEVLRLVRATFPLGASIRLGPLDADLIRASRCDAAPPPGLAPSEAWRAPRGWAVRCGEGAVYLDEVVDAEGEPLDIDAHVPRT
ncbi:MAG: hypothetical protein KF901_18800 [Myxococcales bacterium]|nr:hypothetical protein [Myxococcales bacterium]